MLVRGCLKEHVLHLEERLKQAAHGLYTTIIRLQQTPA